MLISTSSLAQVPESLKPVTEIVKDVPVVPIGSTDSYFCTDRVGSEKIVNAFKENADCHAQIEKCDDHVDWGAMLIGAGVAALAGFWIGHTTN